MDTELKKARFSAFEILKKVESGRFAQDLLEDVMGLSQRDRALLTQLVYGTIRHQGSLDELIPKNTPLINRIILRLAGFQLFFLTRIPHYAVVNESVELAKKTGGRKSAGFINAVLRNWCRKPPEIKDTLSHPEWLVKRWKKLFGPGETEKLCEFNNGIPPLIVRLNTLKEIPEAVLEQFEETGHTPAFRLKEKKPIRELKGYKEGLFQVQDLSGMYVIELLDVKQGVDVLDLCASPGGKTCYMAQIMKNTGRITAVDVSKEKIGLIEENCKRLGIGIVKTVIGDGRKIRLGSFDRILVDAPCSNTGVFRRRVEARWRLKPSDFRRLADIQLELLENAVGQLKLDGKLVYSTCSIDPEENEKVVEKFLKKHWDFRMAGSIKKVPYADNMDGVFGALLARS